MTCGAYVISASIASGALWFVVGASIMSGTPLTQTAIDGTLGWC